MPPPRSRSNESRSVRYTYWERLARFFLRLNWWEMPVPLVAIVGRPNVGKSSLFNWLAGRRISIVDPTAGVTRDRIATLIEAGGRFFELIDTGGMGIED